MAGGEDICTLAKLYGEDTRFIGIDISPVALELARRATFAAGVKADFIEGNATELNIANRSIDGFVLSAILHEVYSYTDAGKDALSKTIGEAYRKTSDGGCIFISDFAAPRIEGRAILQPKSEEAVKFVNYFLNNFRKFNDIESQTKKPTVVSNGDYTSEGSGVDCLLHTNSAFISEVLWHFKHYKKHFTNEPKYNTDPRGWKEINEVYLPPNPLVEDDRSMPINEYIATIIRISRNADMHERSVITTTTKDH